MTEKIETELKELDDASIANVSGGVYLPLPVNPLIGWIIRKLAE